MKNYSKQREEILNAIKELSNHPTAEEVYFKIKEYNSTASKGTVYRNLKDLVSEKIITKIDENKKIPSRDIRIFTQNFYLLKKANFNNIHALNIKDIKKDIKSQVGDNIDIKGFSILVICRECKNKLQ